MSDLISAFIFSASGKTLGKIQMNTSKTKFMFIETCLIVTIEQKEIRNYLQMITFMKIIKVTSSGITTKHVDMTSNK